MLDNKENTTTRQTFSEKYLKDQKQISLRFQLLVMILTVTCFIISLSFATGIISKTYDKFNEIAYFSVSALFSLISGIAGFFYGVEVSKKAGTNSNEEVSEDSKK